MIIVKPRHKLFFNLARPLVNLIIKCKFNFKNEKYYKVPKNQGVLILSNHQTDYDPGFVSTAIKTEMHFVATSTFLAANKLLTAFLQYCFYLIPKKKGISDIDAMKQMMLVAKEHGSICLFAEGNRTYDDNQSYIGIETAKLIKALKLPVIFYNIHGGFGVMPRFAKKKRKGKMYGTIREIMEYEEYKNIPDEELLELVKEYLRVSDIESGEKFVSDSRAEYLERMLFVCPKCGKIETLESNGNYIKCKNCGLEVEYTEDLKLKSNDENFKFEDLHSWYEYQKQYVKNMEIGSGSPIFKDGDVKLYRLYEKKKRTLISRGDIELTKDTFNVGSVSFNVSDIVIASPVSGTRLNFIINDQEYMIVGHERFNPLKYVLIFHKLDTYMKIHNLDDYYKLD